MDRRCRLATHKLAESHATALRAWPSPGETRMKREEGRAAQWKGCFVAVIRPFQDRRVPRRRRNLGLEHGARPCGRAHLQAAALALALVAANRAAAAIRPRRRA
eukprot:1173025-Pleurochrysis_carterae.AAC.2